MKQMNKFCPLKCGLKKIIAIIVTKLLLTSFYYKIMTPLSEICNKIYNNICLIISLINRSCYILNYQVKYKNQSFIFWL